MAPWSSPRSEAIGGGILVPISGEDLHSFRHQCASAIDDFPADQQQGATIMSRTFEIVRGSPFPSWLPYPGFARGPGKPRVLRSRPIEGRAIFWQRRATKHLQPLQASRASVQPGVGGAEKATELAKGMPHVRQ